jgi:hypothetical protein
MRAYYCTNRAPGGRETTGRNPAPYCLGLGASYASEPPAQGILKSALRLAKLVERARPVGRLGWLCSSG